MTDQRSDTSKSMPAGRALVVILVCLLTWTFLYAPTMKRQADASTPGLRRTLSIAGLTPLTAINDVLQITRATDAVRAALGKDADTAPGGALDLPTVTSDVANSPTPDARGPIRTPTPGNRLRVVVVGDSLAGGLGVYMERVFQPSLVRVSDQGRISTGLARPDYFDWPASMEALVQSYQPDLVIVMLGENDAQSLVNAEGRLETPIGTPTWRAGYAARVQDLAEVATSGGARLIWVGLPIVRDSGRRGLLQRQNEIFQQLPDVVPNTVYLDTWNLFATPNGTYTAYHREANGHLDVIREADGIHFNGLGYQLVAQEVAELAITDLGLSPVTLAEG
ncbi:MAG: uncharacterized protein QOI60_562 [Actinomycetota bacterium]|nr:uncharacterized protein [Actinomycetota bacterium]